MTTPSAITYLHTVVSACEAPSSDLVFNDAKKAELAAALRAVTESLALAGPVDDFKKPLTVVQRQEMHPPATNQGQALSRLDVLAQRLRYKGQQYDADIAEMEVRPFIAARTGGRTP